MVQSYNNKLLSLLKFALQQNNVADTSYAIGKLGDEQRLNDKLCLLEEENGSWIVLYSERGATSERSVHSAIEEAATDFYVRLVRKDTPWSYRDAWEQAAGETF